MGSLDTAFADSSLALDGLLTAVKALFSGIFGSLDS